MWGQLASSIPNLILVKGSGEEGWGGVSASKMFVVQEMGLSLGPLVRLLLGMVEYVHNPSSGEQRQGGPWNLLATSLAELVNPRLGARIPQKIRCK